MPDERNVQCGDETVVADHMEIGFLVAKGKHFLVETSCYNPPMGMDDTLDRIKAKALSQSSHILNAMAYMGGMNYCRLKEKGILF